LIRTAVLLYALGTKDLGDAYNVANTVPNAVYNLALGGILTSVAAADGAGLPADARFREALRSHVEFGTQVAYQNSHAQTDDELHPLREVPHCRWPDEG
jgi:hypothetical protein